MRKWILGAFLMALLAGCSTNPQTQAPVEDRSMQGTPGAAGTGATTGGTTSGGVSGTGTGTGTGPGTSGAIPPGDLRRDPTLAKRSVYFDYDSFDIKPEYRSVIESHARYLAANRNARVTIQGNTDERGSREYNIALGQRRADAVRQAMRVIGASDSQIETVSFGKEKPKNPGHDEAAWAENRRADIVYSGE